MYGEQYWGVRRATLLIDGDGVVRLVIPKTHDDEVLAALAQRDD